MTTCEAVQTAISRYGNMPRKALPSWLKQPTTVDQLNLSIAVAGVHRGVTPVCRNGILVAFNGLQVKL